MTLRTDTSKYKSWFNSLGRVGKEEISYTKKDMTWEREETDPETTVVRIWKN